MGLQTSGIPDLLTTTINNLQRGRWTDNMSKLQRTIAMKILLRKNKTVFKGGPAVSFSRQNALGQNFKFAGLNSEDTTSVPVTMGRGEVPWRHCKWSWGVDFREPLMCSDDSEVVDLVKTRRSAEMGGAIEGVERAMWRVPPTTDTDTMFGIPYWVVKSATAATDANNLGFNGLAPTGYTLVGGFDPATDDKWRNYTDAYTDVTEGDFIRKVRRMAEYTNFQPLVENMPHYDYGDPTEYYTNYAVYEMLVQQLKGQNQNVGIDIAPFERKPTFMRTSINNIPVLREDTTNPFYQIDWSVFQVMGLRGAWMVDTIIQNHPSSHVMKVVWTDCSLNTICVDRRMCGVISNGTTLPG